MKNVTSTMGRGTFLFKQTLFLVSILWMFLAFPLSTSAKIVADAELKQNATLKKILVWGDSLSAAYGIPVEKGWVNLLSNHLTDSHIVINGSISGETTQGGLTRLPKALKDTLPDYVILELGANDGLRGLPPTVTKNNLEEMITLAKDSGARVMLIGMKIPPNYGEAYSQKFEALFTELAEQYKLAFLPFFLEEIADKLELFQNDELHPNADAQPILLKTVLEVFQQNFLSENYAHKGKATKKE